MHGANRKLDVGGPAYGVFNCCVSCKLRFLNILLPNYLCLNILDFGRILGAIENIMLTSMCLRVSIEHKYTNGTCFLSMVKLS